jgi:hypothetical protein
VEDITARGGPQPSLTDPARPAMPKSPKGDGGSHGPMAVESPPQLIVAQEVPHAVTHAAQRRPRAMSATARLGVERSRAVADRGDSHGPESNACDEAGLDAYGPMPSTAAHTPRGLCGQERFTDAPPTDCARCPRGAELTGRLATTELGRHLRDPATGAGRSCPIPEQGTRNPGGRRSARWVAEHTRERLEERLNANPAVLQAGTPLLHTHWARSPPPMRRARSS